MNRNLLAGLDVEGSARSVGAAGGHALSTRDVVLLQAMRSFPSVSVLMSTKPGPRMTLTDATALQDLADQAALRLRRIEQLADPGSMIRAIYRFERALAANRTDQAVALYVNAHGAYAFRLSVPVADRVVIDHTFATRDLVLSLQRTPRHVVLVVSSRQARLFESVNGTLQPTADSAFPLAASRPRRSHPDRPRLTEADTREFLREVDHGLRRYRTLHPSPLVVLGPAPVTRAFLEVARRPERLAGTVTGHYLDASLTELARLTRPLIRRYLASREREALELVDVRAAQGRIAAGMEDAWRASRSQPPEMVAVEASLFYPARLSADGRGIQLSRDVDEPAAVDDAVDELIEHVLMRGGWVAFVSDGALRRHGGVVLTTRPA